MMSGQCWNILWCAREEVTGKEQGKADKQGNDVLFREQRGNKAYGKGLKNTCAVGENDAVR